MTTTIETPAATTTRQDTWKEDIYMRRGFDDTGAVPYPGNSWVNSPDIVPAGPTLIAKHADVLKSSMDKDIGKVTELDRRNFFYVRGKNLFNGAREADVELYFCPENLFLFPSLWAKSQMKTVSGKTKVRMPASAINQPAVCDEPFEHTPNNGKHHCLVARVITTKYPNPLPNDGDISTPEALGKFIRNNPNYAWRNVVMVDPKVNFTRELEINLPVTTKDEQILVSLNWRNMTQGSAFAYSADKPVPGGDVIDMPKTLTTNETGGFSTKVTVPKGHSYNAKLQLAYWAQPPIQKGWTIELIAVVLLDPGSDAYSIATPLDEIEELAGLSRASFVDANGNMPRGLKVGSCVTVPA